jgi:hypothetical protein
MSKRYLLILLLLSVVLFSGCAQKQKVSQNSNKIIDKINQQATTTSQQSATTTENQQATTTENEIKNEIKYLPNGEIDNANWRIFDSEKDTGTKLYFSFVYPNDWLHFGSIDGGQFSSIPFYKRNLYAKKCGKQGNKTEVCIDEGKIAEISIRIENQNLNKSNNIEGEKFSIGENQGYVTEKILVTNKIDPHIFISDKVFQYSLADINGMNFMFTMVQEDENSKNVFYTILKSIKFK